MICYTCKKKITQREKYLIYEEYVCKKCNDKFAEDMDEVAILHIIQHRGKAFIKKLLEK